MEKTSGTVELTYGGNTKLPNDEVVCNWVKSAWQNLDIIKKAFLHARFRSDFEEWHISCHDICGPRYK